MGKTYLCEKFNIEREKKAVGLLGKISVSKKSEKRG